MVATKFYFLEDIMTDSTSLNELGFTDLMDIYTTRCEELGKTPNETFKTKEALIEGINALNAAPQGNGQDQTEEETTEDGEKKQKYNSSGRRGPNQGTGAYAKQKILEGYSNAEILEMIGKELPTAKTTMSCIAYYRNALKNQGKKSGKAVSLGDPEEMRKQAAELLVKADQLEKQLLEQAVKGDLEAQIREEIEARVRAEVEARYKAQLEEAAKNQAAGHQQAPVDGQQPSV